jgi:4,5-DOPA dioxygenase extradiol
VHPDAIVVISAHWQAQGIQIASAARPELIYDFGGFPRELYELKYEAPGSPKLAAEIATEFQLAGFEVGLDDRRGWDHGVWVPLRLMFPEARIPVVEISLPTEWSPQELYRVGDALAMVRKKNVLVIGSGGIVHNLRMLNWAQKDASPDPWALEFEAWVRGAIQKRDLDALFAYQKSAPQVKLAVPTPEHFVPLFPVLGSAGNYSRVLPIFEGMEHGNISMYTFQFAA